MTAQITVRSPANIAFIKYWGQKDKRDILPYNDSFSMNLSNCYSIVKLVKTEDPKVRELYIKEYKANSYTRAGGVPFEKVNAFYSRVKSFLGIKKDFGFRIYSENSFPKKAGIASSASFFSALALAYVRAFDRKVSQKDLSILARLSGSGSASRSVPDGFVVWKAGTKSNNSYAYSLAPPSFWPLVDIVLITSYGEKKTSSGEGHRGADISPYFKARVRGVKKRLVKIQKAFKERDFSAFGRLIEEDTISMHAVMMTQVPPLYYWSGKTVELIKKTLKLRESGTEAYFTIDAGENIHIICQKNDEKKVTQFFKRQKEVAEIISNNSARGTHEI